MLAFRAEFLTKMLSYSLGGFMGVLLFLVSSFFTFQTHATIFAADDRKEPYEVPGISELTPAVAMMQGSNFFLYNSAQNTYDLDFPLATDYYANVPLCTDERFSEQRQGFIGCTGFLVADDIVVTAGHCMIFSHSPLPKIVVENDTTSMCASFSWLFGFERSKSAPESITGISPDNVYRCEKVLYAELFGYPLDDKGEMLLPVDPALGQDFAIVKLDRKVIGRKPLKLSAAPIGVMEPLSTIGYPMGLPMKYTGSAKALNVSFSDYIVSDLDVIGGNSGGPLLNSAGEVVGVIVRSFPGEDFVYDEALNCSRTYVCPVIGKGACAQSDGHPVGAHANRITPVMEKLKELGIL